MSIIQLENISFAYTPKEVVLSDVSINVPKGSIYGFLGVNGAGKSTTLRLILGLMKAKKGQVSVFGEDINKTYPKYLSKVGSLIESASLYEHLSAYDNLKIASKYFNVPNSDIIKILETVKLEHTGKKKTKDFSTGMKQRLGLALSLLHDPEILILDEPTNGLDPNGIIELRNILKQLSDDGKTIMLSSHILAEVEKIVDQLGIINNGQIVFEGSLQKLQDLKKKNIEVHFRVSDSTMAMKHLSTLRNQKLNEFKFSIKLDSSEELPVIIKRLVEKGIDIYEVIPQSSDLEKMFLNITKS